MPVPLLQVTALADDVQRLIAPLISARVEPVGPRAGEDHPRLIPTKRFVKARLGATVAETAEITFGADKNPNNEKEIIKKIKKSNNLKGIDYDNIKIKFIKDPEMILDDHFFTVLMNNIGGFDSSKDYFEILFIKK